MIIIVKEWLKDNGIPEICKYCPYDDDCPKCVKCYGYEPVYTPYADLTIEQLGELLDIEQLEGDILSEIW